MRMHQRAFLTTSLLLVSLTGALLADTASDVLALTSNKTTKVAWSRAVGGLTSDYQIVFGSGTYRLMSFSTTTGLVTDVLGATGNYYRAKINHDGSTIFYNSGRDLYRVDWSGSNNTLVMKNAALCCYWYNESASKEYAFVARGTGQLVGWETTDPLYRVCLSDTTDKTLITLPGDTYAGIWLSVSNDGTRLGGHFPWTTGAGGGGIVLTATGAFTSFNVYGCWGMTPPDNSYRYMLYDVDTHNRWAVFNADKSGKHNVNIVPTGTSAGTYCARMSVNDPHFFTLIAPMEENAGGFTNAVGIYLGKLDDNITAVQGWVKIAGSGECLGSSWIDQGTAPVQPVLAASASTLSFSATSGGANPAAKTVTITNSGSGTLTKVTATSDTSWLTVTGGPAGNSQVLTNQAAIAGLGVGTHTAHVTVSGGGASNTVTYTVTLTISLDAPVLTSIVVTPALDSIGTSARLFVTARCRDQRANPIPAIITWTVSGGGTLTRSVSPKADSTDTTSFISNGANGTFRVIATSGQVKDTAVVVVTSSLAYSLSLLSPLGDKNFAVGDTMRVKWTGSSNLSGVVIHISVNDGLTFGNLFEGATPFTPTGEYAWKILPTVPVAGTGGNIVYVSTVSSKVLIEVRGYQNEAFSVSPTAFAIRQGSPATSGLTRGVGARGPRVLTSGGLMLEVHDASRVKVYDTQGRCCIDRLSPEGMTVMRLARPGLYLVQATDAHSIITSRVTLSE